MYSSNSRSILRQIAPYRHRGGGQLPPVRLVSTDLRKAKLARTKKL